MAITKKVQQAIANAFSYRKRPYGNECLTKV